MGVVRGFKEEGAMKVIPWQAEATLLQGRVFDILQD
jgi:hypothetical protein